MRKLILATALALGTMAALPASSMAAPAFAPQQALAAPAEVQQVQYREWRHRRYYGGPRYGYGRPGYRHGGWAYGRRYGGPPPHARAYGYRSHYGRPHHRW